MTLPFAILYESPDVLVVNKPSGVPVHAGPKGGPNIEEMAASLYDPRKRAPQLAHRLDRDTSGCLALGKTKPGLRRLNHLFASRQSEKTYWAIVQGVPAEKTGRIEANLAKRTDVKSSWWMEINESGVEAVTDYAVLKSANGRALVECRPLTGRTHQIRVHLAHIGAPLLGDTVYGDKNQERRFFLHARRLVLPYDADNRIDVTAEPPEGFQERLEALNLVP